MYQDSAVELEPVEVEKPARRRVLIIDDDQDQSEVLSLRLRSQGFDTSSASRGGDGIVLAHESRPDLILLDLRLPDTDGFSVCEQLADAPSTNSIPVIIVSGMERPDIVRRARAAGCQYFIRKPYDPNALLVLIQQALADQRNW